VRSGQYPPGSRLPPQRHLAVELGINVSTVSRAYKELQARGLKVLARTLQDRPDALFGTISVALVFSPMG